MTARYEQFDGYSIDKRVLFIKQNTGSGIKGALYFYRHL
jgi:hypothetical protein